MRSPLQQSSYWLVFELVTHLTVTWQLPDSHLMLGPIIKYCVMNDLPHQFTFFSAFVIYINTNPHWRLYSVWTILWGLSWQSPDLQCILIPVLSKHMCLNHIYMLDWTILPNVLTWLYPLMWWMIPDLPCVCTCYCLWRHCECCIGVGPGPVLAGPLFRRFIIIEIFNNCVHACFTRTYYSRSTS